MKLTIDINEDYIQRRVNKIIDESFDKNLRREIDNIVFLSIKEELQNKERVVDILKESISQHLERFKIKDTETLYEYLIKISDKK